MWCPVFYTLLLALSTLAIRVPVDGKDVNVTEPATADNKQDVYVSDSDGAVIDSYLIPPDPHRPTEVLPDTVAPATYLLPPSAEKQIDYYAPTEVDQQTDWYPIAPVPVDSTPLVLLPARQPADVIPIFMPNNQTYQIVKKSRGAKKFPIHLPSRQLEPPYENSPTELDHPKPSEQQKLPFTKINHSFTGPVPVQQIPILKPVPKRKIPKKTVLRVNPGITGPTLATHLTPPKLVAEVYRKPTKLYPKKVSKGFLPIPIPVSQYPEETTSLVPRAKPAKPFKPVPGYESEYFTTPDEKRIYLLQQAEQKQKFRGENDDKFAQPTAPQDTYGVNAPAEQETSETNYRHPGHNVYPAPLRQAPPPAPAAPQKNAPAPPAPDERTEFRMHGMKGPHSYQFGYDTGKGKNRQFRYEERDDDGRVKGHYGYMDRNGKMRVVNYNADPETGFHAESPSDAPEQ